MKIIILSYLLLFNILNFGFGQDEIYQRNDLNEQLVQAATAGNYSATQHLLRAGANKNVAVLGEDPKGYEYLLHIVAKRNDSKMAELLLEHKANVDELNLKFGVTYTPLHYAVDYDSYDVANLLINCGANVNANPYNFNMLELAKNQKMKSLIKVAQNKVEKRLKDEKKKEKVAGFVPFFYSPIEQFNKQFVCAVQKGNIDAVSKSIVAGANVNVRFNKQQETALHICAKKNYIEIAKLLIANGADSHLYAKRLIKHPFGKDGHLEWTSERYYPLSLSYSPEIRSVLLFKDGFFEDPKDFETSLEMNHPPRVK